MHFNFSYFGHPRIQDSINPYISQVIPENSSMTVGIQPEPLYGIIGLQVEPLSPQESHVIVTDISPGLGQLNVTVRNLHKITPQVVTFRTIQVPNS